VYDVNQGVQTVRSPLSVFDPFRWQSGTSMKLRAQSGYEMPKAFIARVCLHAFFSFSHFLSRFL
jgi:hypothetical protein